MDNINKTVSFILGLVVVLVFLAIITGRLNLKGRLPSLGGKATNVTPTITLTPTAATKTTAKKTTPAPTKSKEYNSYKNGSGTGLTSIPSTGSPTVLLSFLISGLGGGLFLIKSGKK